MKMWDQSHRKHMWWVVLDIFLGSAQTKTGLRMEDVVRVTDGEAENLTNYKCELFEIPCE